MTISPPNKNCLWCGATSESQCAIKADPVGNYCIYIERLERDIAELKHDVERALANHSADLSARGDIERDAARYRWLRKPEMLPALYLAFNIQPPRNVGQPIGEAIDAAIDAASSYVGEKK